MKNDYRFNDLIRVMLNSVIEIESLIECFTLREFISDKRTVSAVSYFFIRLSFASKTVLQYAKNQNKKLPSNVPWRKIANISSWIENYRQKISPSIIWQTVKDDLPEIAKSLREIAKNYPNEVLPEQNKVQHLRFIPQAAIQLSSYTLELNIVPYLKAITNLQELINEILERKDPNPILIRSISQNSPLDVVITGLIEAYKLIQELIPWRKEHAKVMAQLLENAKKVEIERSQAEILQIKALASKEKANAEKIMAETSLQYEQLVKLRLENEKLRSEIENDRNNLTTETLKKLSPILNEQDAKKYLEKLRAIIDVLAESKLEIAN
jgi:uncharacterized protein with HEPN domain